MYTIFQPDPKFYPYGMGKYFKVNGKGYGTILSYPRQGYEWVNYYSGPDVEYKQTGQMTGTATEDNARVIRENR